MQLKQGPQPTSALNRDGTIARYSQLLRSGLFRTALASLAAVALLADTAVPAQQSSSTNPDRAYPISDANDPLDAIRLVNTSPEQAKRQSLDNADAQRKKQLTAESEQLLALATALKTEVDKTNKDMLSLSVIRKADEIEKLAHNVKEKMKIPAGDR